MGFLFLFGLVNILIVGIGGIVLITDRKTVRLGILGIIAALAFVYYAIEIGRDF